MSYTYGLALAPDKSREDFLDFICTVNPDEVPCMKSFHESLTELIEKETYAIKFNVPKLRFLKDE